MRSISCNPKPQPHVVLFPFMAKGHTIPLLHLARLLLHRNTAVTVITTPANQPFISQSLSDTAATILSIPFPNNISNIPSGVESTDKLPSVSLFPVFLAATKLMQPDFEQMVGAIRPINFMVSDGFLYWSLESANKFRIPRLVFYGFNNYVSCVTRDVMENRLIHGDELDDELIALTQFPWIKVSRNDFERPFTDKQPKGDHFDFVFKSIEATSKSYGIIVNSFYELEPVFVDHSNRNFAPKAWCIGPLSPFHQVTKTNRNSEWVKWLDKKLEEKKPVLYVAFGSQAEISREQLIELETGLVESEVNFLWVMRKNGEGLLEYKERGLIVRDWVNQTEILNHETVKGFLSHCGWNSVLESLCAGVPILAWPLAAEQPLNARMVTEEIQVGLRVETINGSVKGFVEADGLRRKVRDLMVGEEGEKARIRAAKVAATARVAVMEGGSSWEALGRLIDETYASTE